MGRKHRPFSGSAQSTRVTPRWTRVGRVGHLRSDGSRRPTLVLCSKSGSRQYWLGVGALPSEQSESPDQEVRPRRDARGSTNRCSRAAGHAEIVPDCREPAYVPLCTRRKGSVSSACSSGGDAGADEAAASQESTCQRARPSRRLRSCVSMC